MESSCPSCNVCAGVAGGDQTHSQKKGMGGRGGLGSVYQPQILTGNLSKSAGFSVHHISFSFKSNEENSIIMDQ